MTTNDGSTVAYFCMEYGLDPALTIYSGGLGVLAGDILKANYDQGRDLVAVGILWDEGYTRQRIGEDGQPRDDYEKTDRSRLEPVAAELSVTLRGEEVPLRAWLMRAYGNAPLFLLEPVRDEHRARYTARLYGGNDDDRVAQELILGVGGVRLLRALGQKVGLFHFNEGHALFAAFELLRERVMSGESLSQAREAVRQNIVFTTHTPVPAGNEVHPIERLLEQGAGLGVFSFDDIASLGGSPFEMTRAAIELSRKANAVAELHGRTARSMWASVAGGSEILSITNGVHMPTWQDPELSRLAGEAGDEAFQARHQQLKDELVAELERRTGARLDATRLIVGFSRRAATYKRATMVLRDLEWLTPLFAGQRIQFVFSAKAHPRDAGGKAIVAELAAVARTHPNNVVFVEDYDMEIGAMLTRGCDVWLNTPRRPKEASGTSGMKAAANGLLNVSILDGWWDEGCEHGLNGWQFGDGYEGEGQDEHDYHALKQLLVSEVLPTFYDDRARWVKMMRAAVRTAETRFSAARMVSRYHDELYPLT
ncbi:MAG: alpha-glucan phosphorylase [Rickettsiales bacterium]|nr:alpha-glucan phosphorylase [Rickettsiales bacterium]